ncbi:MAG: PAS domain-containing protein [Actinobacteria bacterium]|nr:PAS domain-containing protein [Actinomycetota bacterium]
MFQNADIKCLLEGIPHAVVLVDKELRVSWMNRRAEALTGHSNGEVAGIKADFILRSDLHSFGDRLKAVLENRKVETHEGTILDRDRKVVSARLSISPIESHDGEVLGAMLVIEELSSVPHLREEKTAGGKESTRWDDVEKDMIIDALRKSRGRRSDAAKMLGWARSTLYRKLKYHDI